MTTPLAEIHGLNLRFLLLLQQAAKADAAGASRAYGVEEAVCERVAALSLDDLDHLSKTNALVFRGRLDMATLTFLSTTSSPGLRAVLVESRSS